MRLVELLLIELEKIGIIGILLITISFLIGIKYPDWDFKLKIRHRNILTHSPLILWIMIYLYKTKENVEMFRYTIVGFSLAIGLHMVFDSFPKGWSRGALIYLPWCKIGLGVKLSKKYIYFITVYCLFLTIKYTNNYMEYIYILGLGIHTIIKSMKKEEKLFRPLLFFTIPLLIFGAVKFKEVSGTGMFILNLIRVLIEKLL